MPDPRSLRTQISDYFDSWRAIVDDLIHSRQRQRDWIEATATLPNGDLPPPWVVVPHSRPGDYFWREAGDDYRSRNWFPFYDALTPEAQANYLKRWNVPAVWWHGCLDPEYRAWWDHVDDPEPPADLES